MRTAEKRSTLSEEGGRAVVAAQRGDASAFGRLYTELVPKIRNSAYRLIGDSHEAEDTAQDAFLAAYLCLPRLEDPTAFEGWLLRIARNRAVDRRRGMLRCRPSDRAHDETCDDDPQMPRVVRRSGVAEPSAESVASLRGALERLSPALRTVLRQRYLRGLSCQEIARREDVSLTAVKTRLFRARRQLREALLGPEAAAPPVRRRPRGRTCKKPAAP